jgi:hypothetical protein
MKSRQLLSISKIVILVINLVLLVAVSQQSAAQTAKPNANSSAITGEIKWYKGNLHTHSLWSDGNDFPEMIADWYVKNGYHFLALSDHNILSKGDRWMTLRDVNRRGGALALGKYQKRFGDKWVQLRGEGNDKAVKLQPLDKFRTLFEKPGAFLMIQAEEITDRFGRAPVHINATNIQILIKPQHGKSVQDVMRRNLKLVQEQSRKLGKPIIAHLNHPNFGYGVTAEDVAAVVEDRFFEVYNGHPGVRQLGDAQHASVDRLWDIANTIRIGEMKAPPLFGVGTDDSHNYHQRGGAASAIRRSEPGRGWVMVKSKSLQTSAIINAMMAGEFYASSGVTLEDVKFDQSAKKLQLKIKPQDGATYVTQFIGTRKGYDNKSKPHLDKNGKPLVATKQYSKDVGQVLATVKGVAPAYQLKGDELYVRAVVVSSQAHVNPSIKGQKKQAWTQPIGWRGLVKKAK